MVGFGSVLLQANDIFTLVDSVGEIHEQYFQWIAFAFYFLASAILVGHSHAQIENASLEFLPVPSKGN